MSLPDSFHFSMSPDDQSVNGFSECAEKKIIIDPLTIRKVQTEKEALKKAQEIALKIMKEKMAYPKSNNINYSAKNCNKLSIKGESNIFMRPAYIMNPYQFPKYYNFSSSVSPYKNPVYNAPLHQSRQNQIISKNFNSIKENSKCNNLFDDKIYSSHIIQISKSVAQQFGTNGIGINNSELYMNYGTNFNNNLNKSNETPLKIMTKNEKIEKGGFP